MDLAASAAGALGDLLDFLKPEKAKLVIAEGEKNTPDGAQEIECMFNPTEYRLTQTLSVNRNRNTAKPGGTPTYSGTNAMTLTTQLFFDDFASLEGDVTPKITTLLKWTKPTDPKAKKPCPPRVSFKWGGNPQLDTFKGFLKSVVVNYTIFRRDGTPVQAKVDITIEGEAEEFGSQNPTSHAANSRRVHTVIEGDTLQSIAYREYGRPTYWRAIADLNGIDDPLRLRIGGALLIPSVSDAAKGA